MKRFLAILLAAVMCFALAGCDPNGGGGGGGNKPSSSSGIKLTLDNYDQYLSVKGGCYLDYSDNKYQYDQIIVNANVSGASSNYIYNNVVVTVCLSGYYMYHWKNCGPYGPKRIDIGQIPYAIRCNVGGSGTLSQTESLPPDTWVEPGWVENCGLTVTVLDVTGTVSRA